MVGPREPSTGVPRVPWKPAGPPPPRPITNYRWLSHRLSAAIAGVLEQEGFTPTEVLTHVPPYWRSLTGIAIQLDHLTQEERAHPNLLDCNDPPDDEAGLSLPMLLGSLGLKIMIYGIFLK